MTMASSGFDTISRDEQTEHFRHGRLPCLAAFHGFKKASPWNCQLVTKTFVISFSRLRFQLEIELDEILNINVLCHESSLRCSDVYQWTEKNSLYLKTEQPNNLHESNKNIINESSAVNIILIVIDMPYFLEDIDYDMLHSTKLRNKLPLSK